MGDLTEPVSQEVAVGDWVVTVSQVKTGELRASAEKVLAARSEGTAAWVAGDPEALLALLDERDDLASEVARRQEQAMLTDEERAFVERVRRTRKRARSVLNDDRFIAIIDRLSAPEGRQAGGLSE